MQHMFELTSSARPGRDLWSFRSRSRTSSHKCCRHRPGGQLNTWDVVFFNKRV